MKVTVDVKTCFRDRFDFFAHKFKAEKNTTGDKVSEQRIAANEQMWHCKIGFSIKVMQTQSKDQSKMIQLFTMVKNQKSVP